MLKKLLTLGVICAALWFFFAVFTPFLEPLIPAWQKYNKAQEDYGLDSGALYYSNVPQTFDSEEVTRQAVREGMEQRFAQKRSGGAEKK